MHSSMRRLLEAMVGGVSRPEGDEALTGPRSASRRAASQACRSTIARASLFQWISFLTIKAMMHVIGITKGEFPNLGF
jgi:hypothetical protein